MPLNGSSLTITNPLVLYRSLVATNRIKSDPAQHRLALHLQKVYDRLLDYEPSIEYSQRLQQLSRAVSAGQDVPKPPQRPDAHPIGTRGIWTSLLRQKEKRDSLALTRVLTSHEEALNLQSPKGLMLHGEVGTGKSMLINLFADCLPNRKKRRWHFNTFMLDTFSRLEQLRKSRSISDIPSLQDEYSLLWLARDLIQTSPILFLDEFQLPDRAASKILSNLMTSFFQLGGVLIATSNRMPEELAKAAGMEFARPVSRLSRLGWRLGMPGMVGRYDGPGQKGEFAQFLEVLRARCEVWEMEGKKDYRRLEEKEAEGKEDIVQSTSTERVPDWGSRVLVSTHPNREAAIDQWSTSTSSAMLPKNYLVQPKSSDPDIDAAYSSNFDNLLTCATSHPQPIPWTPSHLTIYGRRFPIPAQYSGTALFTFAQLCGATLGPADYITLASTYHTIVLSDVPILTLLQKNEARRLITLLDALYEARCRLLITASAGPDSIFFPEPPKSPNASSSDPASRSPDTGEEALANDAVHPETYSEIHQDLTSPFRPNISSYSPSLAADALEDDPPNRFRRLGSSFTDERKLKDSAKAPDFTNIRGLTGEDERFAVKRAQSRIWEMCSERWWQRGASPFSESSDEATGNTYESRGWWRPLPLASRYWENSASSQATASAIGLTTSGARTIDADTVVSGIRSRNPSDSDADKQKDLFSHGASPFRTTSDPPPKINWTHIWGTVKWGQRAGPWGKGVEGLEERRREQDVDTRGRHDKRNASSRDGRK